MEYFTEEESAYIQYQMNRRRQILWEAEPRPLSPEEEKRRSERLAKFRRYMAERRLPPVVDEARPINRCFPSDEEKQWVPWFWPVDEDILTENGP